MNDTLSYSGVSECKLVRESERVKGFFPWWPCLSGVSRRGRSTSGCLQMWRKDSASFRRSSTEWEWPPRLRWTASPSRERWGVGGVRSDDVPSLAEGSTHMSLVLLRVSSCEQGVFPCLCCLFGVRALHFLCRSWRQLCATCERAHTQMTNNYLSDSHCDPHTWLPWELWWR